MAKRRAGLHREISSIFDGVPLPKKGEAAESPSRPAPGPSGYEVEVQKTTNKWRFETSRSEKEKSSASIAGSAPPPKPERPAEPAPKRAPTKQSKADARTRAAGPNPMQKIWQQVESKLLAPQPGVNPAKQKAMVVLIPVLFIALISVLFQVFGTTPQKTKAVTEDNAVSMAGAGISKINWQIPDPYPPTLRDPMRFTTVTSTEVETGKLVITGILYDENNPSASSASISNQIVYQGEKVMGATVVKINKDSVEFEINGKRWTQRVQR